MIIYLGISLRCVEIKIIHLNMSTPMTKQKIDTIGENVNALRTTTDVNSY